MAKSTSSLQSTWAFPGEKGETELAAKSPRSRLSSRSMRVEEGRLCSVISMR